jgi:phosphatidylinositol alpha-1,6-mannosyltransferase
VSAQPQAAGVTEATVPRLVSETAAPIRVLGTCFDFRPNLGGLAMLGHQLFRAVNEREDAVARVLAPSRPGSDGFDENAGVEIRRFAAGSTPLSSVIPFTRAVRREIRAWQPDLIVNLLWLPDGVASRIATVGTETPVCVFAHGVEVLESRRTLRKRLRAAASPVKRTVFNDALVAFAVSDFTATVLRGFGVRENLIRISYGGVDPGELYPTPKPAELLARHGLEGKHVFLTVARLHAYKGIDTVLRALAALVADHPDAAYVICGEGPDENRLRALVRQHSLDKHVIFTGTVEQRELRGHYNLCDTFVLTPRAELATPDVEGFGLVFLEAAACGKPLIAGASGGTADAAGEHAWLVDPHDWRAVGAAMLESIVDADERARRADAARARVLESFTWSAMAERVLRSAIGPA